MHLDKLVQITVKRVNLFEKNIYHQIPNPFFINFNTLRSKDDGFIQINLFR